MSDLSRDGTGRLRRGADSGTTALTDSTSALAAGAMTLTARAWR